MTCNIANIKINLPTVAGPPPLHYLPPWTPTTTYYSFLCQAHPPVFLLYLFIHPPYSSPVSLSLCHFFTVSFFPHCALQFPFFISSTSPAPSSFSCLCCRSLPTSCWSSLPCWLNIYPSFHPFTAACICVAYLLILYIANTISFVGLLLPLSPHHYEKIMSSLVFVTGQREDWREKKGMWE